MYGGEEKRMTGFMANPEGESHLEDQGEPWRETLKFIFNNQQEGLIWLKNKDKR